MGKSVYYGYKSAATTSPLSIHQWKASYTQSYRRKCADVPCCLLIINTNSTPHILNSCL